LGIRAGDGSRPSITLWVSAFALVSEVLQAQPVDRRAALGGPGAGCAREVSHIIRARCR
jgi:hypothetical protein